MLLPFSDLVTVGVSPRTTARAKVCNKNWSIAIDKNVTSRSKNKCVFKQDTRDPDLNDDVRIKVYRMYSVWVPSFLLLPVLCTYSMS